MYKETLQKLNDSVIGNTPKQALPMLKKNPRISREKQLDIYIEGYHLRLGGAVESDYPTFIHYMGKRKAQKLIDDFVENNSSNFYSLDFYPFKFAEYLAAKKIDPAAKQLTLLESRIAEIFLLPDSESLDPKVFLEMSEAQLDKFRFTKRTAADLLEFDFDVEKFIQQFRAGDKPKKIEKKKNYIFIVRHNNEVKRNYILEEEFLILQRLFAGASLDEAVIGINPEMVSNMLQQFLQKWLLNGFFAGI